MMDDCLAIKIKQSRSYSLKERMAIKYVHSVFFKMGFYKDFKKRKEKGSNTDRNKRKRERAHVSNKGKQNTSGEATNLE